VIVFVPVVNPLSWLTVTGSVATPLEIVAVPSAIVPTLKVTPPIAALGVIVAVSVVLPPIASTFGVAETFIVACGSADTVIVPLPLEAANVESPE